MASDQVNSIAENAINVAAETQPWYKPSMADFLVYVHKRRAELRKELQELETAEKVYRQAHGQETDEGFHPLVTEQQMIFGGLTRGVLASAAHFTRQPKTIQDMVLQLLDELYPAGLTALEILDQIQKRWKPDLLRTSLSPQLSRLHQTKAITNDKQKWYLVVKNETGASVNAPA